MTVPLLVRRATIRCTVITHLVSGACDHCGHPETISLSFVKGMCEGEEHLRDLARAAGDTEAAALHGHAAQLFRAMLAARSAAGDEART